MIEVGLPVEVRLFKIISNYFRPLGVFVGPPIFITFHFLQKSQTAVCDFWRFNLRLESERHQWRTYTFRYFYFSNHCEL